MMNFTEAIQLVKAGNEAGYIYLYNATYQSKYYLALQYMKNESDAQDVIQDSYIKAFANLEHLAQPEAFPSWLGTIVANTAKNALVKRNPMLFSDMGSEDMDEPFENQLEDDRIYSQPELSYTRQETQELVHQLIDSLSDEQRICMLMFHIEGASIKEIAATLGCSENTVKSRLNYGRKNLKFKAEELQKKGWKLWGIAPAVLLGLLLRQQETAMAAEGYLAAATAGPQSQIFQFVHARIMYTHGMPAAGNSALTRHTGGSPSHNNAAAARQSGSNPYGSNTTPGAGNSTAPEMSGGFAPNTGAASTAGAGSSMSAGSAGAGAGLSAASAAGAGAAAGGFFSTVAAKVLIGVVVAALAGTGIGVGAAKIYFDHKNNAAAEETITDTEADSPDASGTESELQTSMPESETTPASETKSTAETESTAETSAAGTDSGSEALAREVLENYKGMLQVSDTVDYGENAGTPTGNYRYALVNMSEDSQIPVLLLSQENTMYLYHVRIFQYIPDIASTVQMNGVLEEGASGGFYRASLALEGDGNGLMLTTISGGTGDTQIERITITSAHDIVSETQWTGRMDQIPSDITSEEIIWYDINDTSALEDWFAKNAGAHSVSDGTEATNSGSQSQPSEQTPPAETSLPEDGDRIVFTGTVNTYTYDEVLALQGIADPNPQSGHSQTYRLIVLDEPRTMELRSSDGYSSNTVSLIDVSQASGLEQYDGQHLTFSIDPASTWWPGDTSLPLGQPGTADVHVLN